MVQSPRKTILIIVVLLMCCAGIILNAIALATEYWVAFHGSYPQDDDTADSSMNEVNIHAGLFRGQVDKCCLLPVSYNFFTKDEYFQNNDFMNFGLWVSTLLFLALAVTFGCIGAVFAGINTVITPIELITGIVGLYVWNGLACLFCIISLLLWVGQFLSHLSRIAETLGDHYNIPRKMDNSAELGYSFYLVLVAGLIYLFNNLLVYVSTRRWETSKAPIEMDEEPANGVIMLY